MNTSGHRRRAGHSNLRGPAVDGSPVRALIVDDSPSALKTLALFLQQQSDLQLIGSATDGYGAVRRAMELSPDLVLMDSQLSGINGLEVTRQIKAHPQAPAVILVTADDTPGCRAAARAAGTDGFVGKRHLSAQLRPAIRKLFPAKRNDDHSNQPGHPHSHKPNLP